MQTKEGQHGGPPVTAPQVCILTQEEKQQAANLLDWIEYVGEGFSPQEDCGLVSERALARLARPIIANHYYSPRMWG